MEEMWIPIHDFPRYLISNYGGIASSMMGTVLSTGVNQQGIAIAGLVKDGRQYKRSVALLVAKAFLPPPPFDPFDTPIHLDGNRLNTRADNLAWRPRWFAVKYHAQFKNPEDLRLRAPIEIVQSGEQFADSHSCAVKYGLLNRDIVLSCTTQLQVFPTGHLFRQIDA